MFPRPIFAMFGTFKPTVFEIWPSVSEAPSGTPALTKSFASGAAPIPTESRTTKCIRLNLDIITPQRAEIFFRFSLYLFFYFYIFVNNRLRYSVNEEIQMGLSLYFNDFNTVFSCNNNLVNHSIEKPMFNNTCHGFKFLTKCHWIFNFT